MENNKDDIIFEMYQNKLLTPELLQFSIKRCTKYFDISSVLIKNLIKDENISLLDVVFNNITIYDNEFIIHLLLHYKSKEPISTFDINQEISNEKYKIITKDVFSNNCSKYLFNECDKDSVNINTVKFLVEHGIDINQENENGEIPLFDACKNGNESIVKYLVEHGANINQEDKNGKTSIFDACESGN
ncbi:hypothetical protein PIROE2DRAFT_62623 [Piromyces sp. E2]|nr:hypothetical protein PIROE2DRAFT_62623 [Piromyces sp. E2]|eukprot:OUM61246.1 hypothetical protein PIROE2DRAFT_62623 [Piromyces sp. E2]